MLSSEDRINEVCSSWKSFAVQDQSIVQCLRCKEGGRIALSISSCLAWLLPSVTSIQKVDTLLLLIIPPQSHLFIYSFLCIPHLCHHRTFVFAHSCVLGSSEYSLSLPSMILIGLLFLLYASVSLQYHVPVASQRRDSVLSVRDTNEEIHPNRVAIVDDQSTDIHLGQHDAVSKARLGERCGPGKKKCESYLCCSLAGTLASLLTH